MRQSGYDVTDIADRLKLSPKTVRHYLRISRSPKIAKLVLEGILGVQGALERLPKAKRATVR
jgi:predicted transcriptional regulator